MVPWASLSCPYESIDTWVGIKGAKRRSAWASVAAMDVAAHTRARTQEARGRPASERMFRGWRTDLGCWALAGHLLHTWAG